jgi:cation transport protein ChaC
MSLYVFGYGSLMWRPGFPYKERALATVRGRHRRLCVYSWVHRGTRERPGLVLGLDRGGACRGVVFTVAAADADDVVAYLRAREQVTSVYLERTVPAVLADGRVLPALTYVVDRRHPQYAGELTLEETLAAVRGAAGQSGANEDYVVSTADHLAAEGIADPRLAAIAARLREP